MTPLDVFGGVMNLLFFVPFLFPLAPWLAKRPRGAWRVCFGAVSVLVLLFPVIFSWGCDWSNCGQGAVAIFILAPVWLLFAVITPFSTWAAARKLASAASAATPRATISRSRSKLLSPGGTLDPLLRYRQRQPSTGRAVRLKLCDGTTIYDEKQVAEDW
jgi:hypothetical protein